MESVNQKCRSERLDRNFPGASEDAAQNELFRDRLDDSVICGLPAGITAVLLAYVLFKMNTIPLLPMASLPKASLPSLRYLTNAKEPASAIRVS